MGDGRLHRTAGALKFEDVVDVGPRILAAKRMGKNVILDEMGKTYGTLIGNNILRNMRLLRFFFDRKTSILTI